MASKDTYSSLNENRKDIRLVTIHAGLETDPIDCSLAVFSLNDKPVYEALSYVWGDPSAESSILLNKHEFKVTTNLAQALRNLRIDGAARILWVDAICINQNDIPERNSQVLLMGEIYQSARRVVSWIGLPDEETDKTFQALRRAAKSNYSRKWMRQELGLSPGGKRIWDYKHILQSFYSPWRPYWSRAWITQELAFARDGIIRCGEWEVPYSNLENFSLLLRTEVLSSARELITKYGEGYRALHFLVMHLKKQEINWRAKPGSRLLDLLERFRIKDSTDPRDKVFAVLGLSDLCSSKHPGLQISYYKSLRDVYLGAFIGIVEETASLDILCASNLPQKGDSQEESNLPTWVPDWRTIGKRPYWALQGQGAIVPVAAAADTKPSVKFDQGMGIMATSGFCIGTICSVGERIIETDMHKEEQWDRMFQCVSQWHCMLLDAVTDSDATETLFLRTISLFLYPNDTIGIRQLQPFINAQLGRNDKSFQPEDELAHNHNMRLLSVRTVLHESCRGAAFVLFQVTKPSNGPQIYSTGISNADVREGDKVCVFLGCSSPMVIRPKGAYFEVVGELYAPEFISGEAVKYAELKLVKQESFDLC